jgi:hypothetical protein
MHENREISCASWSADQDRSAKAINRAADTNVQEKSGCAVIPVNRLNNEEQPSAEAGEGRPQSLRARARRIIMLRHNQATRRWKMRSCHAVYSRRSLTLQRVSQGLSGVRKQQDQKQQEGKSN